MVVERVEPAAELRREPHGPVEAEKAFLAEAARKRALRVVGHDEVRALGRLPDLEDRDDVPRLDPAREARLAEEARARDRVGGALRPEQLQRDDAPVLVRRLEDEPRRALAEQPPEPVGADALHGRIIPGR